MPLSNNTKLPFRHAYLREMKAPFGIKNPPICIITYMERTSAGGMRQPRFNGFRED